MFNKQTRCYIFASKTFESNVNLNSREYRQVVLNSAITIAPAGHNRDSFRIYEALEAGSIPIIDGVKRSGNVVLCCVVLRCVVFNFSSRHGASLGGAML